MQIRCVVTTPLHQERLPGASAIRCNTWVQLAGTRHGAMQIRCVVRLCNLRPPGQSDTGSIFAARSTAAACLAARHCAFVSLSGCNFARLAWPPIPVCPLLAAFTFATAPPDPNPPGQCAGSFRLLAEGRAALAPIHENLASPTRAEPPRPTSRRAGTSPRLATETLASSLASAALWKCAGLDKASCSDVLSARSLHRPRLRRSGYDARSCASVPMR